MITEQSYLEAKKIIKDYESQQLNITDVSESILITKNELQSFLEDWDDGKQNVWDADWNDKSKKIAKFLGLVDDITV